MSAADGHALQNATVRISEVRGGRSVASAVSGGEGEFSFAGLSARKYSLSGESAGYISASYDDHEGFSTAIVTGAGVDTESLVLRLISVAGLSGRVVDEAGEPVRGAQITLYKERHDAGRSEVGRVGFAQTDDFGEYALGALGEGRYYLAAKAVPWYAVHPQSQEDKTEPAIVTGVDPALDVAYPATFYPGVTEAERAAPIELKGGDNLRIDLHMNPVRAVRLTFQTPSGEQMAFPRLQMRVFGETDFVLSQRQNGTASGGEIVGLAPGRYEMVEVNPKTGRPTKMSTVDLRNGSAALGSAALGSAALGSAALGSAAGDGAGALKVLLEDAGGAKLSTPMQVQIRGQSPGNKEGMVSNEKGEAVFSALRPDRYSFQVYGAGRAYRIVQMKVDGKRLVGNEVNVSGGETTVTVVTTATAVAVEGVAKRDGKAAAGAMVVLVPVDGIDNVDMFRRDQSDLDGTFALPNVSAGRYIVVAIADGWKLDWSRLEVLTRYLQKGVAVEVPVSAQQTVELPDALVVQPR